MSVQQYCRLCAKLSLHVVNIFDELGKRHLLFLKIKGNLNIVLSEHDPLSKYVCILCIGKLDFTEKFKRECQTAQLSLRKFLRDKTSIEVFSTTTFNVSTLKVKANDNENDLVDDESDKESLVKSNNDDSDVLIIVDSENVHTKDLLQRKSVENKSSDDCIIISDYGDDDDDDSDRNCELSKNDLFIDDKSQDQEGAFVDIDMEVEELEEDGLNDSDDNDFPADCVETVLDDSGGKDLGEPLQLVPEKTLELVKNLDDNDGKNDDNINTNFSDDSMPSRPNSVISDDGDLAADCRSDDNAVGAATVEVAVYEHKPEPMEILYFRLAERQSLDASEWLMYTLPYLSNLIENKCSIMPYFLRWTHSDHKPRIGFKCPLCHHFYFDRITILKHLAKHFYFTCYDCDSKMFRTDQYFKRHYERHHSLDSVKISCKRCKRLFKKINSFISHAPCVFIYRCSVCTFEAKSLELFHVHMKTEHSSEENNCKQDCASLFLDEDDLKKHVLALSSEGFVCESCEMVFHTKVFLDIHCNLYGENHGFNKAANEETIVGDICHEIFAITSSCSNNENSVSITTDPIDAVLQKQIATVYKTNVSHKVIIDFFKDILDKKIKFDQLPLEKRSGTLGSTGNGFVRRCPFCKKCLSSDNVDRFINHVENHLLLTCFHCKKLIKRPIKFASHFKNSLGDHVENFG